MTALLTIAAALLSPLIALQVSRLLDERKERRQRQLAIFRALMASRANKLSHGYVEALNLIDIEFYKVRAVTNAWKEYLDYLSSTPQPDTARINELSGEMLRQMGLPLGYDFDRVHLKNQAYLPIGHGEIENDQYLLRKGLIALLDARIALPIFEAKRQPAPALPNASAPALPKELDRPKS